MNLKTQSGQRFNLAMIIKLERCTLMLKLEWAFIKTDLFLRLMTNKGSLQQGFALRVLNSVTFISYSNPHVVERIGMFDGVFF